jgi:hypothetical protein
VQVLTYIPIRDQDTDQLTRLCSVNDGERHLEATNLIDRFPSRYTIPKTAHQYRADATSGFAELVEEEPGASYHSGRAGPGGANT